MGKRRDRASPYNTSLSIPPPPPPGGLVDQKNRESWVHLGGGSDSPWTLPVDLLLNIMYVLYTVFSTYLGAQIFFCTKRKMENWFSLHPWERIYSVWLFRASDISRKNSKISRDFQGQIRGKIGQFHGIFAGEKSNSPENRLISQDFSGKKSNFEGFSGANS